MARGAGKAGGGADGELAYDDCEIITGDGLKGLPNEAPFDVLVAVRFDSVPDALKRWSTDSMGFWPSCGTRSRAAAFAG